MKVIFGPCGRTAMKIKSIPRLSLRPRLPKECESKCYVEKSKLREGETLTSIAKSKNQRYEELIWPRGGCLEVTFLS